MTIPIDPSHTSEHAFLALRKFPVQVGAMLVAAFVLGMVIGSWV